MPGGLIDRGRPVARLSPDLAAALTVDADVLTSADGDLCAAAGRRGLHVANPLVS